MFEKLAKTVAFATKLLGIEKVPIEEGKVAFTDDQKTKLSDSLGAELTTKMIAALEKEISAVGAQSEEELELAKKEILAVMEDAEFSEEEKQKVIEASSSEDLNVSEKMKQLHANYLSIKSTMEEQKKTIDALIGQPEPETGKIVQMAMNMKFKHSASHLFGSGQAYDKFVDRPWNERFRDGGKATDFASDVHAPILKGDLQHFIRTNPGVIESLFNDFEELPSTWGEVTGVADQYTTASVLPSEVLQGRSKGWNPKGKVKIAVEQAKVYAKKIDITFDGQQLQTLENTWIAETKDLDGSHPWKMSFIYWVLSLLVQAVKRDERMSMINGIFVQTPDGDDFEGAAVNSQNGLRWLFWYYRDVVKKYVPFSMGAPTEIGFEDYIRKMIESIPEKERKEFGYEIILTEKWMKIYQTEAGTKYQLKFSSDLGKQDYYLDHPIDYPNFKFQVLKDNSNNDFIAIIKGANIKKLEFRPEEKNQLSMTHDKRDTHFFGDYKSGIAIAQVGMKAAPGEPSDFTKQLVYSNDMPVFDPKMTVPAFDDFTGELKINYNNIAIDDSFKTDIVNIEGLQDLPFMMDLRGQVIKITGSTKLATAVNVKKNGNLDLASDFNLKLGGTLTLYCKPDGKFKELARTLEPETPDTGEIEFTDEGAIDANMGIQFNYVGLAGAEDTLTEILNGVDGKTITITKTSNGNGKLTISTVPGKIVVTSPAALAAKDNTISLVRVEGVWYEVSRTL